MQFEGCECLSVSSLHVPFQVSPCGCAAPVSTILWSVLTLVAGASRSLSALQALECSPADGNLFRLYGHAPVKEKYGTKHF